MKPSEIEQTKLLANSLDRASTSCFTVGIATPVAGYVYNVANFGGSVDLWRLLLGLAAWIIGAVCTTLSGKASSWRVGPMSDQLWFLAFIVTPALVVLGGYIAVRLHERSLDRHHRHPAE